MEYVQERVTTLHDLTAHVPAAPLAETAVVVPVLPREVGRPAAEHTFATLASLDLARVVVPVRAPADRIGEIRSWLSGFDLPLSVVWCDAPAVDALLADAGLDDAPRGKGADVWLGLGVATADPTGAEYVVVHDADATSYDAGHVPRLVAPLADDDVAAGDAVPADAGDAVPADGYAFTKGYYARVEDDGLYGRLCRLFYEPLLGALAETDSEPIVDYLGAFRYALAGEFATTADVARSLRAQRAWGLELGTLGEAFRVVGPAASAQVDLGIHRHEHRSVDGDDGLATMSEQVGDALFRALADHGVEPEYDRLADRYREHGDRLVQQYAADAAHNGLPFDRAEEREQVEAYADAIGPPGPDTRLPAWEAAPIAPTAVLEASRRAIAEATPDGASRAHSGE